VGEIPHQKALVKRLENEPFVMLGVNSDSDKDDFRGRAAESGVTWRSAWEGSTRGPLPTKWGVDSWPTVFVLDHEHVLRKIGARGEQLGQVVDELLAEMKAR